MNDLAVSISVVTGALASALAALFLAYLNWRRNQLAADAIREIHDLEQVLVSGFRGRPSALAEARSTLAGREPSLVEALDEARLVERRLEALADRLDSAGLHDERARLARVAMRAAWRASEERRAAQAAIAPENTERTD